MRCHPHRFRAAAVVLLVAASLAGCQKPRDAAENAAEEMDWARAALERNPAIEVVSADHEARRFTLRLKANGELVSVPLGTLVAGPAESFLVPAAQPAAPEEPPTEPETAAPAVSAEAESPAPAQPAGPEAAQGEPSGTVYTVERSASGVRVTGPGVTIESAGLPRASAESPGTMRSGDPIICEGARLLQIDSRTLTVSDDAIVARDGCEIHITNSRIDSSHSAIVVRNARVHVSNSDIRGSFRSLDINDGGRVYARSSRFTGLLNRRGSGEFNDLGGNRFD
jgi:hypothetical protein